MAKLIVDETQATYVFNPNFSSYYKIAKELKLPAGTKITIVHVAQDHLDDDHYVVEQWWLDHDWRM